MSPDNPDASLGGNDLVSPGLPSQAKQDLGKVTDQAKHDLDKIKEHAAEDMRDLRHEAGAKVGEVADKAKSFAADQKDLAAGQVNGVAAAINKVADELDGSDQAVVGRYARDLASGLTNLGKTIEDNDVDDLMGMAQDFGRKQPVAFLGAAALAGFMASRFALASAHRRDNKPTQTGNQGAGYSANTETNGSQGTGYSANASNAGSQGTYSPTSGTTGSNRSGEF